MKKFKKQDLNGLESSVDDMSKFEKPIVKRANSLPSRPVQDMVAKSNVKGDSKEKRIIDILNDENCHDPIEDASTEGESSTHSTYERIFPMSDVSSIEPIEKKDLGEMKLPSIEKRRPDMEQSIEILNEFEKNMQEDKGKKLKTPKLWLFN